MARPIRAALIHSSTKPLIASIPMGRLARPDNVANATLYLASDEAAFITVVLLPRTAAGHHSPLPSSVTKRAVTGAGESAPSPHFCILLYTKFID